MAFTSFAFLVFVAAVVLIYYLTPSKYRWAVLLLASYGYYLQASAKSFAFILITTVVTFYGAKFLDDQNKAQKEYLAANKDTLSRDEKKAYKESVAKKKKRILTLVLVIDFGILILLKLRLNGVLNTHGLGLFRLSRFRSFHRRSLGFLRSERLRRHLTHRGHLLHSSGRRDTLRFQR